MATRKKATTRRRMLARLYRGNTFHPDQVTISTSPPADEAARLEVRVIDLATTSATQTNPDRATFIRRLRRTVAYGLGRITRTATEAENTAKAAGTAAGQRAAARAADDSPQTDTTERLRAQGWGRPPGDQDDEDTTLGVPSGHPGDGKHLTARQARRVTDAALQAPRSPETGNTVRVPKALADTFRDMAPTIIGSGSALYDDIVRELAANPPTSDADRRRTAQRVIDKFTERGITGLVDKGGRRWNLTTYVEMATRTAATNIARQAQTAALTLAGLDLVRVTVMPNCNPLCQPFQGRLLSLTGAVDRDPLGEPVVTTLQNALTRGYNHPSCRHSIVPHIPGDAPSPDPGGIDPGDYKAVQTLRAHEVNIRKAKRAKAAALTPEARTKANVRLRAAQAALRHHIDQTGLKRVPLREQIDQAR